MSLFPRDYERRKNLLKKRKSFLRPGNTEAMIIMSTFRLGRKAHENGTPLTGRVPATTPYHTEMRTVLGITPY